MLNIDSNLPIGVFDSGVGGLTVLRALQQHLPHESYLYLGDTARLPYGTKSPDTVTRYAKQAAHILHQRGVKLLVVACNTASAHALASLQQDFNGIPVIGVIEPGAAAAAKASESGNIIVLATESTVQHGAYQQAIKRIRPQAQVIAQSCSVFVALAEEGWVEGPIAEAVARAYLDPLFNGNQPQHADCIVLGCTHFPALSNTIEKIITPEVTLVDSAHTTALAVVEALERAQLLKAKHINQCTTQFLATDAPDRFIRVAQQFLSTPLALSDVERVEL